MDADPRAVKAIDLFHKSLKYLLYLLLLPFILIRWLSKKIFKRKDSSKAESNSNDSKEKKPFLQLSATTIIILIVVVALVAYNYEKIPGLLTKGEVGVGQATVKTGIRGFLANSIADIKDWFSLQYGFKQPKVEEKQPSGIKIQDFTAGRTYFEEGQQVTARARIHIDALPKDDALIRFWCESEGNQGRILISRAEGDTINLKRSRSRDASVVCEIEKGLNAGDGKPITRKVKLTGEYINFATKSALKVYTLAEDSYKETGTKDPFEYFGVDEPLLSSGNIIKPQCVSGCGLTLLSLRVSAPQPLTELGTYFLDINLQKDRDWYGEIRNINDIKILQVPKAVKLEKCDPEISVEEGQTGNVENINALLKDKKEISFSCRFTITNPDAKLGENIGQFIVEANYNYAVESTTTVDIKPASSSTSIATGSFILNDKTPLAEVLR